MASSTTVIAALKYQGGVVIAADSQVSDLVANVRWPLKKPERVGELPFVLGFSGSVGQSQRARQALKASTLHINHFKSRERVQRVADASLKPVYDGIKAMNVAKLQGHLLWDIALWGLGTFWADSQAHIIEFEINGDSSFHDYFHAIGSGAQTAYAVYRTLGGHRLGELTKEAKALLAVLRILKTSVMVDMTGVSEPLVAWTIHGGHVRQVSKDEVTANMQLIDEWETRERALLFND